MSTPLTQDVFDVIESMHSPDELLLMRPVTSTGKRLRDRARELRVSALRDISSGNQKIKLLEAEVDGLREQNAILTERLQLVEAPAAYKACTCPVPPGTRQLLSEK